MSFSRDLGLVTSANVLAAVEEATAHSRGILSDTDKKELERISALFMTGKELPQNDKNTLTHLSTVKKGPQHPAEEVDAMIKAAKLAEAGVALMGGKAHVHLGGSYREVEDPNTGRGLKRMQTSITVTITTTSGEGVEPAVLTPPKKDTRVPAESAG